MIRVALAGAGYMGQLHLARLQSLPGAALVAVADTDPAARAQAPVRAFASVEDLLAYDGFDAIVIATPTRFHYDHAFAALEARKHVFVEKPLATLASDARELAALAEVDPRIVFTVGHVERFNPAVVALVERLGDMPAKSVSLMEARRSGLHDPRPGVRRAGVGIELATHDLDVMNWVHGLQPEFAYGLTTRVADDGFEDMLVGMLRWSDGTLGTVAADWLSPAKVRTLRAVTDQGTFTLDYLDQRLAWKGIGPSNGVSFGLNRDPDPLTTELRHFVACIEGTETPRVTARDGLAAVSTAIALLASAQMPEASR